jgi:hypothetical protein
LEQLARGALSHVYKGQDLVLRRPVAVKVVPREYVAAYQAALESSAPLTHPAVVCMYDAIERDGSLFLVQELLTAKALTVYFRQGVTVERGLDLGRQLASALSYAHLHDVAHGDLTPSAVLVDRTACLRINNFGLPPDETYFAQVAENLRNSLNTDTPTAESATPATADAIPVTPATSVLATPEGDTRAIGYLLWQLLSEPVASLGTERGDELRRFRDEMPQALRDLVLEIATAQGQHGSLTAHALVLELERLSVEVARSRPATTAMIPPAVVAARAAAQEAPWAAEETLQNGRRPWSNAHPTASTLPDATPLSPPHLARTAAVIDRPESPPALPQREARTAVAPRWEPAEARHVEPELEARGFGFPLIGVLLLGTVLFVLFFLVGYFSTVLH